MEKEFIPYEQALALKELGFDEPCLMFYEQGTRDKYLQKGINDDYWGDYSEPQKWNSIPNKPWKPFCKCISAPTFSQAFRWFREKYKIFPYTYTGNGNLFHYCMFIKDRDNQYHSNDLYLSNEEAELECLKKLIEIVKNK